MSFDYSKLRGRIVEKFGTLGAFATSMDWSERTNGLKINGVNEWKQSEIVKAGMLLGIESSEYDEYFFTTKVQTIEQKGN